jgi:hypothetical protein
MSDWQDISTAPRDGIVHEITPNGESTEKWALNKAGFRGSMKQLTCCGRCGDYMRKGPNEKRRVMDVFKHSMHFICDECYASLP